ncbi:NADPH-dependent FMN reductase [Variovorax sp. OV329]|uniref:NADPH-dependent FMN reductase n=1 Tax=Variovorax sp. OV329 TaxID=1882825 RepID=UPI0008F3241C|nr:NAD(P)H-dependent oxidoreductase [Variovorax sp. OV329]SFN03212.1 NAD(P)H-dependent FMN reductase [Variovorax sp. OV329]
MSSKPLIGVILGASRQGRLSEVPAHWIHQLASQRQDLRVELVDLGHHPLPFFDAPSLPGEAGTPRVAIAQAWRAALDRLDGFVVVVPGDDALRIARQAGAERTAFLHKPVGFVGYGRRVGMSNVHALRSLASALRMAPMSREVHLSLHEVMSVWQMDRGFDDYPHLARAAQDMLDELSWWAHALRAARERPAAAESQTHGPMAALALLRRAWRRTRAWASGPQAAPASLANATAGSAVPWPR